MVVNGTTYASNTPHRVVEVLEQARQRGTRIRVHYGERATGRDWMDTHHVRGTVGRSMGPQKIPLLLATCKSTGGCGILTGSIVRIRHANRKDGGDLYRHPSYHIAPNKAQGARLADFE